jgi:hypothetical protein
VEDDIFARPRLRKRRDAHFCSVKGLRGLYDMRASFATQLEDAKGQTQPDSKWVTIYKGQWGDYRINLVVLDSGPPGTSAGLLSVDSAGRRIVGPHQRNDRIEKTCQHSCK